MSEDQLKAFLKAIQGDTLLQERLKAAADADAIITIAKEAGFALSEAEIRKAQAQQTLELSEEELEDVAGGCLTITYFICAGTLTVVPFLNEIVLDIYLIVL
jgi:predicted ribosomally synthesized peptide with nif11-like leader